MKTAAIAAEQEHQLRPVVRFNGRSVRSASSQAGISSSQKRLSLHAFLKNSRWGVMSDTVIFAAVRTSPGRRGVPRYLSKLLAQVWLVGEPASQRYITQGRFSLQHVLSRQLDAPLDHEGMR
jgi:hypothetical protein